MFLDFVEIGTSDFETEIEKIDNKIGISIEAVKFYIDRLPDKEGCIKINNGVSNFNGEITIYYVPVESIIKYNLPFWIRGCNSVNHYHPTVLNLLNSMELDIKNIAVSYTVPCKTLINILHEYNVQGLHLLKIDTEGHDVVILEHFLNNFEDNKFLPHNIIFESNVLTNQQDVQKTITLLESLGYDLILSTHDTIMKLNLTKLNKKGLFSTQIANYYIEDYPTGFDPNNLPYENTLEDAQKYCIEHNYSGITYQYGRYEMRNGRYINYYKDPNLLSWVLL